MASVQPTRRPQNLILDDGNDIPSPPRTGVTTRPRQFSAQPPDIETQARHPLPPLEIGKVGGTDRRTADRLKKGRFEIDARLDLHGYSEEKAYYRLLGFLRAALLSGARCVLVVTGKGRQKIGQSGKLKSAVPRWLNEPAFRPAVLTVTYAQQKDGGDGALYVLLRKNRRNLSGA